MKKLSEIIFENREKTNIQFAKVYVLLNGKKRLISVYKNITTLEKGVEIYQGSNYIIGSNDRSYSRHYKINDLPTNYSNIVDELMISLNTHFETV